MASESMASLIVTHIIDEAEKRKKSGETMSREEEALDRVLKEIKDSFTHQLFHPNEYRDWQRKITNLRGETGMTFEGITSASVNEAEKLEGMEVKEITRLLSRLEDRIHLTRTRWNQVAEAIAPVVDHSPTPQKGEPEIADENEPGTEIGAILYRNILQLEELLEQMSFTRGRVQL